MRTIIVLVCVGFDLCNSTPRQPNISAASAPAPMAPLAQSANGGLSLEVNVAPDGQLRAFVRDSEHVAVRAQSVRVFVRRPDQDPLPVVVNYDEGSGAYVGRVVGVPVGQYPVQVSVQYGPTAPVIELVSPPVQLVVVTAQVPPLNETVVVNQPSAQVVVQAAQPVVVVEGPQPVVVVEQPRARVVVEHPASVLVIQPPSFVFGVGIGIGVEGHGRGHGHGHGHGRGHGRFRFERGHDDGED